MGDMASLWGFEEYHDAEHLGQKLLVTSLELEKLKAEAKEEMRKNSELMYLLNFAIKERDDAKSQLHKLLNKANSAPSSMENLTAIPHFQTDSPLVKQGKANSSITESNSLSEPYNYHSHSSSPVDSLFDAVPSPEFTNINFSANKNLVQEQSTIVSNNCITAESLPKFDQASFIIDNLVRGKPLPQNGKFLQAVLDSGPLLQTLFMAGSLPRWRNPPQLQPSQIPPVTIKGCGDSGQFPPRLLNHQPYSQMSCGTSQVLSTPMLSFADSSSGQFLSNGSLICSGVRANPCLPMAKRQRLC